MLYKFRDSFSVVIIINCLRHKPATVHWACSGPSAMIEREVRRGRERDNVQRCATAGTTEIELDMPLHPLLIRNDQPRAGSGSIGCSCKALPMSGGIGVQLDPSRCSACPPSHAGHMGPTLILEAMTAEIVPMIVPEFLASGRPLKR